MGAMDGPASSASPPADPGYELLDAGDGRRLERFGPMIVDRPSPASSQPSAIPGAWSEADLVYQGRERALGRSTAGHLAGGWLGSTRARAPWTMGLDGLTFELRPTAAGQVGLFPEQRPMLSWLAARLAEQPAGGSIPEPSTPTVLNLYGYTGAATLACARAGARVAHVDASRPAVAWARRNAELSGLAGAPIRWIVDDARAFVARELRRGHLYQGLVLDPPSYGHGPHGGDWRLERHLPGLLEACARIVAPDASFVLLTAHTPGQGPDVLADRLGEALGRRCDGGWLQLVSARGAVLRLGAYARWSSR